MSEKETPSPHSWLAHSDPPAPVTTGGKEGGCTCDNGDGYENPGSGHNSACPIHGAGQKAQPESEVRYGVDNLLGANRCLKCGRPSIASVVCKPCAKNLSKAKTIDEACGQPPGTFEKHRLQMEKDETHVPIPERAANLSKEPAQLTGKYYPNVTALMQGEDVPVEVQEAVANLSGEDAEKAWDYADAAALDIWHAINLALMSNPGYFAEGFRPSMRDKLAARIRKAFDSQKQETIKATALLASQSEKNEKLRVSLAGMTGERNGLQQRCEWLQTDCISFERRIKELEDGK